MKKLILLLILISELLSSSITAKEANKYIGKYQTVCGKIVSVHYKRSIKGSPTFLSVDKAYPNQKFSIVIWDKYKHNFKKNIKKTYLDKSVCITGKIYSHNDVLEIFAKRKSQIKIQN